MSIPAKLVLAYCENKSKYYIFKLNSPSLAKNNKIELDDLCPTAAAEVVKNLSVDNENGVDFKSPLEEQN